MAFTVSPNMQLTVPNVGTEPGPNYAFDINTSLTLIDGHDHTPGKGVAITPSGLNINATLTFNDNMLSNVMAIVFQSQTSVSTAQALYVAPGTEPSPGPYADLWFNDGVNPAIQLTSNGAVNATIASIPGESYGGGTFTWRQGTGSSTPANFDIGSVTIRPNIPATTNGVTLSASSTGAYSILFPAVLPAAQAFVTIDNGGNLGFGPTTANGITASNIANNTITSAQIANNTITLAQMATSLNLQQNQVFSTSGTFTAKSTQIAIFGCGGGGAGGGGGTAGGGGGAGAVPFAGYATVTVGDVLTVTVGAGGTAGIGINGTAGGDTSIFGPSVSFTCNTSPASNVLTAVSSITGLRVGQQVTGTGISNNSSILAIGTNTVTISTYCTTSHTTITATAKQLLFYAPGGNGGGAGAGGTGAGGVGPSTTNGSFIGSAYFTNGGSGNTAGSNGQNSVYALGGGSDYGSGSGTGSGTPGIAGTGPGAGGGGGGTSTIGGQYGGGGGAGLYPGGGGGTFAVTATSPLQAGGAGGSGIVVILWAGT